MDKDNLICAIEVVFDRLRQSTGEPFGRHPGDPLVVSFDPSCGSQLTALGLRMTYDDVTAINDAAMQCGLLLQKVPRGMLPTTVTEAIRPFAHDALGLWLKALTALAEEFPDSGIVFSHTADGLLIDDTIEQFAAALSVVRRLVLES
jgi:hypothetical protein